MGKTGPLKSGGGGKPAQVKRSHTAPLAQPKSQNAPGRPASAQPASQGPRGDSKNVTAAARPRDNVGSALSGFSTRKEGSVDQKLARHLGADAAAAPKTDDRDRVRKAEGKDKGDRDAKGAGKPDRKAGAGKLPPRPIDPKEAVFASIKAALPPGAVKSLESIRAMLGQPDLGGQTTLLQHLNDLATRGVDASVRAAGLTTRVLLGQLVAELANPGLIRQGNKGTCAATTVQYYMALNHPAEYARVARELLTQGQTTTASGVVYRRDDTSIARDNNPSRLDLDRIVQVAFMDQDNANGRVLGGYDNARDLQSDGKGGMYTASTVRILQELTAGSQGNFNLLESGWTWDGSQWQLDPASKQPLLDGIQRSLARGVESPVALKWDTTGSTIHSSHALLVTKVQDGQVYLRNPWGGGDNVNSAMHGPPREVLDASGNIRMTLAEFTANLQGAGVVA